MSWTGQILSLQKELTGPFPHPPNFPGCLFSIAWLLEGKLPKNLSRESAKNSLPGEVFTQPWQGHEGNTWAPITGSPWRVASSCLFNT